MQVQLLLLLLLLVVVVFLPPSVVTMASMVFIVLLLHVFPDADGMRLKGTSLRADCEAFGISRIGHWSIESTAGTLRAAGAVAARWS